MNNSIKSEESMKEVFEREIHAALSPVFAKTLQELLPGYLPLRQPLEFSTNDILLYKLAYSIITELIEQKAVEVIFVTVKDTVDDVGEGEMAERKSERRYRLSSGGGKKRRQHHVAPDASVEPLATRC